MESEIVFAFGLVRKRPPHGGSERSASRFIHHRSHRFPYASIRGFRPQVSRLGLLCLLLLGLWIGTLVAADTFRFMSGFEEIAERGKVPSFIILTDSNRFSFLPPAGWNVSHNPSERKVTLVSKDRGANMSFTILPADAVTDKTSTMEGLRDQLLLRFPDAKVLRSFPCFSGGQAGLAFDLERSINKQAPVSLRVAVVHYPGGSVEFMLTAASQIVPKYHRTFSGLLGAFQIESLPPKPATKK